MIMSNQKFDNFISHFGHINFQKYKISRCKSLCRKFKKGYGCTKRTKIFDIAGWRCWGNENKNEPTAENVLPKFDKEKTLNRRYIMMRCLYTLVFSSNLITLTSLKWNILCWKGRMLKAPPLIFSDLHLSVIL